MPLISVIIPVYNTGKYLDRCVGSILGQNIDDIELILVDDGSTDESPLICATLAKKHTCIKYIHQYNKGVSSARNLGLEHATGEYIHFFDSDDYIVGDFYYEVTNLAKLQDADICCTTICSEDSQGRFKLPGVGTERKKISSEEAVKELLLCNKVSYSLCDKLFKRDIISGVRLDEQIFHNEDFLFCYEAIKKAKTVLCISKSYYHYCHNEGSAVNSAFNSRKLTAISAQSIVYSDVIKAFPRLKNIALLQYCKVLLYMSAQMSIAGFENREGKQFIRSIICKNIPKIIFSNFGLGYKINAIALCCGWWTFSKIIKRSK